MMNDNHNLMELTKDIRYLLEKTYTLALFSESTDMTRQICHIFQKFDVTLYPDEGFICHGTNNIAPRNMVSFFDFGYKGKRYKLQCEIEEDEK